MKQRPISPSAASDWIACPRLGAYRVLDRRRSPSSPAQLLGTRAHWHAELWIKEGRHPAPFRVPERPPPDGVDDNLAARLASAWIRHLPARLIGAEMQIRSHAPASGVWGGRVDFLFDDYQSPAGPRRGVGDFKTSSNVGRYARTPATLLEDPAAIVYASGVLREFPDLDAVPLLWIYAQTRGKVNDRAVYAVATRERVELLMSMLDRTIGAPMREARRRGLRATDITPNPRACGRYGGCKYRSECPLTLEQKLEQLRHKEDKNVEQPTLFQILSNHPGAAALPSENEASTPSEAPASASVVPASSLPERRGDAPPPGPYEGVNRPDPVPSSAPVPSCAPGSPLAGAFTSAPAESGPQSNVQERPIDALASAADRELETRAARQANSTQEAPPTPRGRGFVLVLNAQVSPGWPWGDVFDLTGLVRRAARMVAEGANVPDYRLVEYGKGAGMLAAQVSILLDAEGPAPGQIAILHSCPEADHCLAEIRERVLNSAAPEDQRGGVIEGTR